MHNHAAARSAVWADLDALVLEEVDALSTRYDDAPEQGATTFLSDDDFLTRAGDYLRLHAEPERLFEQLRNSLEFSPEPMGESPTAEPIGEELIDEEPPAPPAEDAPPEEPSDPAAADEGGGK